MNDYPSHKEYKNKLLKPRIILLTGGTGFLGSNLAIHLLERGHKVILLKRSFSNTARIDEYKGDFVLYDLDRIPLHIPFEENKIDLVLHCATNYGRHQVPPSELIQANLILPLELLQLAKMHKTHGFINTDTILPKGVSLYALSKRQFSDWLQQFSENLVCIDVALEHFYGPHDDPTKFVTRIMRDILNDVDEVLLTPGLQKRDFVYITDVVDAFLRIMDYALSQPMGYFRFEVGTGRSVSIREMVTLLKALCGNQRTNLRFGAIPYRKNEPMDIHVDISNLTSLGWNPRISLSEGLKKAIELEIIKETV